MPRPRFANVLDARPESNVVLWVRRVLITIACVHILFFCWAIFRRLRQILRIELTVSSAVLRPGSTVSYDVITSGETMNRIRLELLQGAHSEVLLEQRAAVNGVSAYDPRVFRYTPTVVITPAVLARFTPGPATLRLTGFGGQKLLQTPAPRVRELPVQLAPAPR
jgi:hypothetical protein